MTDEELFDNLPETLVSSSDPFQGTLDQFDCPCAICTGQCDLSKKDLETWLERYT